jgi:hypothetical protein
VVTTQRAPDAYLDRERKWLGTAVASIRNPYADSSTYDLSHADDPMIPSAIDPTHNP